LSHLPDQCLLPLFLLMKECLHICSEVFPFFRCQILARQHEDRKIGSAGIASPFGDQLKSIHFRQDQVENYKFRQGGLHIQSRLCAIRRGRYRVPILRQYLCNKFARRHVILNDKDGTTSLSLPTMVQAALNRCQQNHPVDRLYDVFVCPEKGAGILLIYDGNYNYRDIRRAKITLQTR
jgi:hypothetical protein